MVAAGKGKEFVTVEGERQLAREKTNWLRKKESHTMRIDSQLRRAQRAQQKKSDRNVARDVPGEVKQIVPDALSTGRFSGVPDWPVLRCPPRWKSGSRLRR